ncbi:MAG: hypothetical protein RLY70_3109 [Planctomycetota bacterium]|jgi:hypothetical protein
MPEGDAFFSLFLFRVPTVLVRGLYSLSVTGC